MLATMAQRIAPSTVDPEDLLSDAIAALLAQWARGTGPKEYVTAYVIQSMRNRAMDSLRSPRAGTYTLDAADDVPAEPSPRVRRVELTNEMALVREALKRLPSDQRTVLIETVVNGRRPRELEKMLERRAPAISTLTNRAKTNLRRAMLQVLIEMGDAECRRAARRVPNPVPEEIVLNDKRGRPTHFATCDHCRRSWSRFLAIPGALGLAVFLVVGDAIFGAAPSASAAVADSGAPQRRARWQSKALLVAGLLSLAAALLALVLPLSPRATAPGADIEVLRSPLGGSRVEYSVMLEIQANVWHPMTANFWGSQPIVAIDAPEGWACVTDEARASCEADDDTNDVGIFVIEYAGNVSAPGFELQVAAETESGAIVTARASGAGID